MEKLKEMWEDRQTRALIVIGGYVIFFAAVFAMFLPGAREVALLNEEETEAVEEEEIIINPPLVDFLDKPDYEYDLLIIFVDESEILLNVKVTEQFLVEIDEEKTDEIKTALLFNNIMLNRMMRNGELVARNVNYQDQTESEVYFLNSEIFEQLLFERIDAELVFTFSDEDLLFAEINFYESFDSINKININYVID